jgi:hypothetical protein
MGDVLQWTYAKPVLQPFHLVLELVDDGFPCLLAVR